MAAVFAAFGPVHWLSVAVLPATLAGGHLRAAVARRLRPGLLRRGIGAYGIAVGLSLLIKALG